MGIGRETQKGGDGVEGGDRQEARWRAGGGRDGGAGWGPGSTQIGGAGVAHLRGSRDQGDRFPGTLCGGDSLRVFPYEAESSLP